MSIFARLNSRSSIFSKLFLECYNFCNLRRGMRNVKHLALFSYGLFLSAVIGIIAAIFLVLESGLSELVWSGNNQILQVGFVIIGSVLLYFLLKKWPHLPETSKDSLAELKEKQTIDYQDVFINLLITLVILIFGAGVGPEAALLSAIISLSIWQADNLRYLYFQYDYLKQLPIREVLKRLFDPFKYRQRYDENKAPKSLKLIRWKRLLYAVFIVNGLLAFYLLLQQTNQPSFILKLGKSHWRWQELWLVPVLMIVGYLFSLICKLLLKLWKKLLAQIKPTLLIKVALGAVGIIAISFLAPDLLFSGQHSLHLLIGPWQDKSPLYLTIMAFCKLIFLGWCLTLNWRGGDIFPLTFAAITQGFALAALLPNNDHLLVVAIVAVSIMSELASPIVGGIFLLFFFPASLSPIIILVAGLFYLKNKLVKSRETA